MEDYVTVVGLFLIPLFFLIGLYRKIHHKNHQIEKLHELIDQQNRKDEVTGAHFDQITAATKALILSHQRSCGLSEVYIRQNFPDRIIITAKVKNPATLLANGGAIVKKISATLAHTFSYENSGKVVVVNIDFDGKWQQNNNERFSR